MLTGHVPEGSQLIILGVSIRTSSSLLLHTDLSQYSSGEGLTPEETLSKLMFDNNGFLTYRARDGSLVRHTVTENPWTLVPEDPTHNYTPLDMAKASETPNTVFARAPPTVLLKDVRTVAACLGKITGCKLSSLTNTFEQVVEITYQHEQSMWLADNFQLGSVRLETAKAYSSLRDALLDMDEAVAEEDRTLAACISAGTKYGSREMLETIKEEERVLEGHNESEPPTAKAPPALAARAPERFPVCTLQRGMLSPRRRGMQALGNGRRQLIAAGRHRSAHGAH